MLKTTASKFFENSNSRTKKISLNILGSISTRALSVLSTLILVPLTIHYIDSTRYGIWLTLSGIIQWTGTFDVGLGNGLRNKLTIALSKNDIELARSYISTAYASISILVFFIFLLFNLINPFISWSVLLNAPKSFEEELSSLAYVVLLFFLIQMVLQLINVVFTANQKSAMPSLINCLTNIFSLCTIYALTQTTEGSLLYLGVAISLSPLFIQSIFSLMYYLGSYSVYRPSLKYIKLIYVKNLVGLGGKFFIIQIAMIVCYQSANLIVSQLYGPSKVTALNIADKYFGIIMILSTIIMFPLWSAFTEAYAKREIIWIKKTVKRLQVIFYFFLIIGIIMLIFSDYAYKIWIGDEIKISWTLSFIVMLKYIVFTLNNIYNYFINGVGKLKVQLIAYVAMAIINIPLSVVLGKVLGVEGVVLSTVLLMACLTFIHFIQYRKILSAKAIGIWDK